MNWRWKATSARRRAWADNRFARSVIPVEDVNGLTILDRDETIRPTTNMQALGALNASFSHDGQPGRV